MKMFLAFILFIANSCPAQLDSFFKDNRWYYCSQPHSDAIRSFFPLRPALHASNDSVNFYFTKLHSDRYFTKPHSDRFERTDTACDIKRKVILQGPPNPCGYKPDAWHLDFQTAWICLAKEDVSDMKFVAGEKLQFDGCNLYKDDKFIAHAVHRGFILKDFGIEDTFMYKGILTSFIY